MAAPLTINYNLRADGGLALALHLYLPVGTPSGQDVFGGQLTFAAGEAAHTLRLERKTSGSAITIRTWPEIVSSGPAINGNAFPHRSAGSLSDALSLPAYTRTATAQVVAANRIEICPDSDRYICASFARTGTEKQIAAPLSLPSPSDY